MSRPSSLLSSIRRVFSTLVGGGNFRRVTDFPLSPSLSHVHALTTASSSEKSYKAAVALTWMLRGARDSTMYDGFSPQLLSLVFIQETLYHLEEAAPEMATKHILHEENLMHDCSAESKDFRSCNRKILGDVKKYLPSEEEVRANPLKKFSYFPTIAILRGITIPELDIVNEGHALFMPFIFDNEKKSLQICIADRAGNQNDKFYGEAKEEIEKQCREYFAEQGYEVTSYANTRPTYDSSLRGHCSTSALLELRKFYKALREGKDYVAELQAYDASVGGDFRHSERMLDLLRKYSKEIAGDLDEKADSLRRRFSSPSSCVNASDYRSVASGHEVRDTRL